MKGEPSCVNQIKYLIGGWHVPSWGGWVGRGHPTMENLEMKLRGLPMVGKAVGGSRATNVIYAARGDWMLVLVLLDMDDLQYIPSKDTLETIISNREIRIAFLVISSN